MNVYEMALAGYLVCLAITVAVTLREKWRPVKIMAVAWLFEVAAAGLIFLIVGPIVAFVRLIEWVVV